MMGAYEQFGYVDGVPYVAARWDPVARTVTSYDESGAEVGVRPYTPEENAVADADAAQVAAAATEVVMVEQVRAEILAARAAIGPSDAAPGTDTLNAIINTPNSVINTSPAAYVKGLARIMRELTRAAIRLARLTIRDLAGPVE